MTPVVVSVLKTGQVRLTLTHKRRAVVIGVSMIVIKIQNSHKASFFVVNVAQFGAKGEGCTRALHLRHHPRHHFRAPHHLGLKR